MERKNDVKSAVALNTLAVFVYFFIQWLLTIIVTRISGYEDAGFFTLSVSFANIFCYVSNFGVRNVQIADTNRRVSFQQYMSLRIFTSLASVVLFLITILVMRYEPVLVRCCVAMMVYKLLESYVDLFMGEMQLQNRYDWIFYSYSIKSIGILVVFVATLLFGRPLDMCIWGMCLIYGLITMLYDVRKLHGFSSFNLNKTLLKELGTKCFPLTIMYILDALIIFVPKHFVEVMIGSEELGYYGTVTIVIVVLQTLGVSVWNSLIPEYSRMFNKKEWGQMKKMTITIVAVLAVFTILLMSLGQAVAPFFYKLIFGEEILNYMFLLPSVIINSLLLLYNSYFVCFLVPLGKNNLFAVSDTIAVFLLLPLCYLMCQKYGLIGASYSLSAALLLKFLILLFGSIRLFKESFSEQF